MDDSRHDHLLGLDVTIGTLDTIAYAEFIEPALREYDTGERPVATLLFLAEELADAFERAGKLPLSAEEFAAVCHGLISCVYDAEDAGHGLETIPRSPYGDCYLRWQELFLLMLLTRSVVVGHLLSGTTTTMQEAVAQPRATQRRSYLQFWLLAATCPEFPGASLPPPDEFLRHLATVEQQIPVLSLLRGTWDEWPPFRPDNILSLGGAPNQYLESIPLFDWTLRGREKTHQLSHQLHSQLRRFFHLEYLRDAEPEVHSDVLTAIDHPSVDPMLRDYDQIAEASRWTDAYACCWSYVTGDTADPPANPVVPQLQGAPPEVSAEILRALRNVYSAVHRAAAEGLGLFVLFHPPRQVLGLHASVSSFSRSS